MILCIPNYNIFSLFLSIRTGLFKNTWNIKHLKIPVTSWLNLFIILKNQLWPWVLFYSFPTLFISAFCFIPESSLTITWSFYRRRYFKDSLYHFYRQKTKYLISLVQLGLYSCKGQQVHVIIGKRIYLGWS